MACGFVTTDGGSLIEGGEISVPATSKGKRRGGAYPIALVEGNQGRGDSEGEVVPERKPRSFCGVLPRQRHSSTEFP